MGKGLSVTLHFVDGKPDQIVTATEFNWQGRILKAPRIRLDDALKRPEASKPGVYILLGETDDGLSAYIGESEEIKTRLGQHVRDDKWDWNEVIIITSSADNLHKAHIKYLEARLYELASKTNKHHLTNGQKPTRSQLSEAETSNMEGFLEILKMVLPAVQVDMFEDKARPSASAASKRENEDVVRFELTTPKNGVEAIAELKDGEIVVLKGSVGRKDWPRTQGRNQGYRAMHRDLLERGILEPVGENARFTENYAFSSPSAAAAILNGRAANGRVEWKLKGSNTTYAQWEADQLKQLDSQS